MSETTASAPQINLGRYAAAFGGLGFLATMVTLAIGLASEDARRSTLHSYLFAVMLFMSLTLGCFALSMLQHVLQAKWGLPILRIFEAGGGMRNFLLMAVLFIPIALGAHYIYPWAQPESVAKDAVLQHRAPYLNWNFVGFRFLLFFAVWIAYAIFIRRSVQTQEATGRFKEQQKRANWCSPGLVIIVLSVTFGYTDWVMALDPHWFSTMYGLWFVTGMGLAAVSLAAVISCLNANKAPYNQIVNPGWTNDIGNLMFTFTMLWGYTNLGQYLIIWHGNLPETATYLVNRSLGHWSYLSFFLVIGQFFIPFFCLLSPTIKKSPKWLAMVGMWILFVRVVDHFHVIEPFFRAQMTVNFVDILSLIGVGGLWAWMFSLNIKSAPLFPTYDPRIAEVPEHAH
jgi:hypothetical protein